MAALKGIIIDNIIIAAIAVEYAGLHVLPKHAADQFLITIMSCLGFGQRLGIWGQSGLHRRRRKEQADVANMMSLTQNIAKAADRTRKM